MQKLANSLLNGLLKRHPGYLPVHGLREGTGIISSGAGKLPHKSWIDAVTPSHPVWLNRMDGHMSLANSLALKIAGVSRSTPEVPGDEIVRDKDGTPAGVLKDSAQNLVTVQLPKRSAEHNRRALEAAMSGKTRGSGFAG